MSLPQSLLNFGCNSLRIKIDSLILRRKVFFTLLSKIVMLSKSVLWPVRALRSATADVFIAVRELELIYVL